MDDPICMRGQWSWDAAHGELHRELSGVYVLLSLLGIPELLDPALEVGLTPSSGEGP